MWIEEAGQNTGSYTLVMLYFLYGGWEGDREVLYTCLIYTVLYKQYIAMPNCVNYWSASNHIHFHNYTFVTFYWMSIHKSHLLQHTTYVMLPSFDKDHSTVHPNKDRDVGKIVRIEKPRLSKINTDASSDVISMKVYGKVLSIYVMPKLGPNYIESYAFTFLSGIFSFLLVCTFRTIKFSSVTIECLSNLTFKIQPNDSSVRGLTVCKTHTMYHTV